MAGFSQIKNKHAIIKVGEVMENEILSTLQKQVKELSTKLEFYYQLLECKNELDFVMRGSYLVNELTQILNGTY